MDSTGTPDFASVTSSAASKVLISGAYLIIDPSNEGIVLATDAKFHTTIVRETKPQSTTIYIESQ